MILITLYEYGKPAVGCWILCMHVSVVSMRCGG